MTADMAQYGMTLTYAIEFRERPEISGCVRRALFKNLKPQPKRYELLDYASSQLTRHRLQGKDEGGGRCAEGPPEIEFPFYGFPIPYGTIQGSVEGDCGPTMRIYGTDHKWHATFIIWSCLKNYSFEIFIFLEIFFMFSNFQVRKSMIPCCLLVSLLSIEFKACFGK